MSARVAPPPVTLDLAWQGELSFTASSDGLAWAFDGDRKAGPSPVQALAASLAACMAIDVVLMLTKGRLPVEGLRVRLVAERQDEQPRRLVAVQLHFEVTGDIPPEKVERAVGLSRDKYCSVWHSLRADIDLRTSFEIRKGDGSPTTG